MTTFAPDDVLILGAGAAGMMCAAQAGQAGLRVRLIDHAGKIGEKIRISGGGRCNFTNTHLNGHDGAAYFVSQQPRFVRHALSRYHAGDFVQLLARHGIEWQEKHRGQLFCRHSATDIIALLQRECAQGQVQWHTGTRILSVDYRNHLYQVHTEQDCFQAAALVVATGGLAAPAIGASGFGYELAKQFGHSVIPPQAALVPLRFEHWQSHGFDALAGIALPVTVRCGSGKQAMAFEEDLLFRHKGLSGHFADFQLLAAGANAEHRLMPAAGFGRYPLPWQTRPKNPPRHRPASIGTALTQTPD